MAARARRGAAVIAALCISWGLHGVAPADPSPARADPAKLAADPDVYDAHRAPKAFYSLRQRYVCVLTDAVQTWAQLMAECDACTWVPDYVTKLSSAFAEQHVSPSQLSRRLLDLRTWRGGGANATDPNATEPSVIAFRCPSRIGPLRALMSAASLARIDVRIVAELGSPTGLTPAWLKHVAPLLRSTERSAFACACSVAGSCCGVGREVVLSGRELLSFIHPATLAYAQSGRSKRWRELADGGDPTQPLRGNTSRPCALGAQRPPGWPDVAAECATAARVQRESAPCYDEAFLRRFRPPSGWERYRLRDFITKGFPWEGRECGRVCADFNGSLAAEFILAQLEAWRGQSAPSWAGSWADHRALYRIVSRRLPPDATRASRRAPAQSTSTIHLRIGDVIDEAPDSLAQMLRRQTYFYPHVGPIVRNAYVLPLQSLDCVAGNNLTLMAAAHAGGVGQLELGDGRYVTAVQESVTKSCLYVLAIRRYFEARGATVALRLGGHPDDELVHALHAGKRFFYGGGGYGLKVSEMACLHGQEIVNLNSACCDRLAQSFRLGGKRARRRGGDEGPDARERLCRQMTRLKLIGGKKAALACAALGLAGSRSAPPR